MPLPSGNRVYTVQQIWQSYHEILRLKLLGMKNKAIADIVKLSPVSVSTILNSPVVRRRLEEMQAARDLGTVDVAKRIAAIQVKAVTVLEEILDDDEERSTTRAQVAQDMLDRGGHGAIKRQEVLSAYLTSDDILKIRERAQEIRTGAQQVIDI